MSYALCPHGDRFSSSSTFKLFSRRNKPLAVVVLPVYSLSVRSFPFIPACQKHSASTGVFESGCQTLSRANVGFPNHAGFTNKETKIQKYVFANGIKLWTGIVSFCSKLTESVRTTWIFSFCGKLSESVRTMVSCVVWLSPLSPEAIWLLILVCWLVCFPFSDSCTCWKSFGLSCYSTANVASPSASCPWVNCCWIWFALLLWSWLVFTFLTAVPVERALGYAAIVQQMLLHRVLLIRK